MQVRHTTERKPRPARFPKPCRSETRKKMKQEKLEQDCYYHIYNRGINGGPIFKSNENKSYFLKLINKYLSNKVSILAYCLMDNHYHMAIQVIEEEQIVTQAFPIFSMPMPKHSIRCTIERVVSLKNILEGLKLVTLII